MTETDGAGFLTVLQEKGVAAMAVSGIGAGFYHQNNASRKTKNAAENNFYEEISDAAKQMLEADKENKQSRMGQTPMERFVQASKAAGNVNESGDEDKVKNESLSSEEMIQLIREKMEELYEKIKKGETEQSFQIGASSFTIKEWEKFIQRFDESEEEADKLIKEAGNMQKKAAEKKESAEKDSEEEGITTEIVIKPDGSRVLLITMNFDGMETTMTIQISEPSEEQNEKEGQEIKEKAAARETAGETEE